MQILLNQIEPYVGDAPNEQEFAMWRAVLSLVYADDDLADMEDYLVQSVGQVFKFSEDQKGHIQKDIDAQTSAKELFRNIEGEQYQAQFFRLARILIWCDGILHEDELEIIEAIKDDLGDEAIKFESDLRWMARKPDLPMGESAGSAEEEMMKHILFQMIAFYGEM